MQLDQKCEPPVNSSSQGDPYDSDSSDDRYRTVEVMDYQPSAVDHRSTTDFMACIRQYMYYPRNCDDASYIGDVDGDEPHNEAYESDWTHHTQVWECSDPENCGEYQDEYWRPCSPNDEGKESGTPFIDSDSEVPANEPQDAEEPDESSEQHENEEEANYASSDGNPDPGYEDQDAEEENYTSSNGAEEGDDEYYSSEEDA